MLRQIEEGVQSFATKRFIFLKIEFEYKSLF